MLKGTRTAHTVLLDLLLASHFLNKACECHCPATVFSACTQGCWSFPLIAHYAVLKGTRTADTVLLDLLLANHFLNKACECHCPATVFSALHKAVDLSLSLHTMQCWRGQEQPILSCWIYCLLVTFWTRLASGIVLPQSFLLLHKAVDLSLSLHTMQCWRGQEQPIPSCWIYCLPVTFLNKACECHCPATVFFVFTQGCWSFPLIAHYAMLKGTRTAHTVLLDLLLASHVLNKACECHCPAAVFSACTQGCWSFPLIAHYAMLKGTRTADTVLLDLLLASHFLNKACECHCPATVFSAFKKRLLIFPSHCTPCSAEGYKNSLYCAAGFTAC